MSVDWRQLVANYSGVWHCVDCDIDFVDLYPPECPYCKQTHVNEEWLQTKQLEEDKWWTQEQAVREKMAADRKNRALQYRTWLGDWIEKEIKPELEKAGIPMPEDERIFGKISMWRNSNIKKVLRFLKRYWRWERCVGCDLAFHQAQWEMWQAISRMRKSGMTYAAIAKLDGVSVERIRQIDSKVERQQQHGRNGPPVEKWLADRIELREAVGRAKRMAVCWNRRHVNDVNCNFLDSG